MSSWALASRMWRVPGNGTIDMGGRVMALQPGLCSDPLSCSTEAMRLGPASGLLVDWLETLDPEVVCTCPDLQWKLLFSRRKVTDMAQCPPIVLPLQTVSPSLQRGGVSQAWAPCPRQWCMSFWVNTGATSGTRAGMG